MFKYLKNIFNPLPSFFDICVAGFLSILFVKGGNSRSIFIVFYIAFIVALSIGMKPKRQYKSLPLTLLVIWSAISVFIHSFDIYPFVARYPNYYLMVEGFLYIFLGALFIRTVIIYSTNLKFVYFLFPIAILPWYTGLVRTGSTTPIAALGASIVAYLFLSKRFKAGILIAIPGLIIAFLHRSWIFMKFSCRPLIWGQLAKNMFYHPVRKEGNEIIDVGIQLSPFLEKVFDKYIPENIQPWFATLFGSGFSQYVGGNYTWVDKDNYGWLFRQNDYLALGEYLGPVAFVFVMWFVIESLVKIGARLPIIGFMTVALVCFAQQTMFIPGKAGIYLMIGVVCLANSIRRNET